jgi:large subunit ribosomal protein L19
VIQLPHMSGFLLNPTYFLSKAVEIMYELYNPTIQSIEVIKLEKRLDDNLVYLRDCPLEYSTIPFDMVPVRLPPGAKCPLNPIKIKLNPKPWHQRWDRKPFIKGIVLPPIPNSEYAKYKASNNDFKPFEKYDLMRNYRETIHDTDYSVILKDLKNFESQVTAERNETDSLRKIKRMRDLPKEN